MNAAHQIISKILITILRYIFNIQHAIPTTLFKVFITSILPYLSHYFFYIYLIVFLPHLSNYFIHIYHIFHYIFTLLPRHLSRFLPQHLSETSFLPHHSGYSFHCYYPDTYQIISATLFHHTPHVFPHLSGYFLFTFLVNSFTFINAFPPLLLLAYVCLEKQRSLRA